MDDLWLVVGLGNPGPGYAANRHNVGQQALAVLADRHSAVFKNHRSNAAVALTRTPDSAEQLVLAKPNTFMNVSGAPVAALMRFYKIAPHRLIVLHDELDVPFDSVRLKHGGGHGGHNGIRAIMAAIGTGDFTRVRIGIGRPPGRQAAADFVLRDFDADQRAALPGLLTDAADAAELIATHGLTAAQLKFHSPR